MPVFNAGQTSAGVLIGNLQQALKAHLKALDAINDLYAGASGLSQADLEAVGFSPQDANTWLSAIADAHAEYLLHTTGEPPNTYPAGYVYGASQNAVLVPVLGS